MSYRRLGLGALFVFTFAAMVVQAGEPKGLPEYFAVKLLRFSRVHKSACQAELEGSRRFQDVNPFQALRASIEHLTGAGGKNLAISGALSAHGDVKLRRVFLSELNAGSDQSEWQRVLDRLAEIERDIQDPRILTLGVVHRESEFSGFFDSLRGRPSDDISSLNLSGVTREGAYFERFYETQNQARLMIVVKGFIGSQGIRLPLPPSFQGIWYSLQTFVSNDFVDSLKSARLDEDALREECDKESMLASQWGRCVYVGRALARAMRGNIPRNRNLIYDQFLYIDDQDQQTMITYVRIMPESFRTPRKPRENQSPSPVFQPQAEPVRF